MRDNRNPSVEELLAQVGCPYPAGSAESVAWLQGRKAGVLECLNMVRHADLVGVEIWVGEPPQGWFPPDKPH